MKTHKGAKRRFHISATGKVMRTKGPKSHLRRNKSASVKQQFDKKIELGGTKGADTFARRMKRLIVGAG
jgi:large subunit ribosomal protein L35